MIERKEKNLITPTLAILYKRCHRKKEKSRELSIYGGSTNSTRLDSHWTRQSSQVTIFHFRMACYLWLCPLKRSQRRIDISHATNHFREPPIPISVRSSHIFYRYGLLTSINLRGGPWLVVFRVQLHLRNLATSCFPYSGRYPPRLLFMRLCAYPRGSYGCGQREIKFLTIETVPSAASCVLLELVLSTFILPRTWWK